MNTLRHFFCIVTVTLFQLHSFAQEQSLRSTEQIEQIEKLVLELVASKGIPGLSIAVGKQNQLWLSRGFGQADVENLVPATADTKYRTASIAKSLTAVLIMSLVENETIDLDANIRQYCQDYPEKHWPITTRQLLGHLGGVRHYRSPMEASSTEHFFGVKSALSTFREDALLHEPGTTYVYSSFGYNLLGAVAEGATGRGFVELLREKVLEPAKMQDTVVDDTFAVITGRSRGYIRATSTYLAKLPSDHNLKDGDLYNASLHDTSMKIPGGGLLSTAPDLVRFASAVNSGTIVGNETRRQMWAEQKASDGKSTGYGLGWKIENRSGRTVVSHTGSQAGTSTVMMLVPETETSVAIMCNLQYVGLSDLAVQIISLIDAR